MERDNYNQDEYISLDKTVALFQGKPNYMTALVEHLTQVGKFQEAFGIMKRNKVDLKINDFTKE